MGKTYQIQPSENFTRMQEYWKIWEENRKFQTKREMSSSFGNGIIQTQETRVEAENKEVKVPKDEKQILKDEKKMLKEEKKMFIQ